jgi:hypothetical protein
LHLTQDTRIFQIVNGGTDVGTSIHYGRAQSGTERFAATERMNGSTFA